MTQKFMTEVNTLIFEQYKEKLDKAMTSFFKKFINWKSEKSQLSSLGYMGSSLWTAAHKMSGKISALFEGIIFDLSHEDLHS